MPELLLELGTEELPAAFVRKAYTDLLTSLSRSLGEAGVLDSQGVAYGTPRRLIIGFPSLSARQSDQNKEQRGPSLKAAYDQEGNPTPALLGFCRGQGIEVADLSNDGQYVWANKLVPGRPTAELLAEILPQAIRSLSFDKTMRWGAARMRFARPIRWILATFDKELVSFEVESVASGTRSRGHRFYAPEEFDARSLDQLLAELRNRKVEPDPNVRRDLIERQAKSLVESPLEMPEALLDENIFLTEWPTAILGEFQEQYQALPEPVLTTAMAKHEKMFPVRDASGKLKNQFIFIRNSGEDDSVRQGSEWVLNARFNDAKFFFDDDARHNLDYFVEKTSGIVFQDKLGTVRDRAERLASLARIIAERSGATPEEAAQAELAGKYAKADLATGLVAELSSLQGIVGGEYARREAYSEGVANALAVQYSGGNPANPVSMCLVLADNLDKLTGFLGVGLVPSGSSDPFGLRRACTQLIEASWNWARKIPDFDSLMSSSVELYSLQGVNLDEASASKAFWDLLSSRYEALLSDARHDLLDAALRSRTGANVSAPRLVRYRLLCLERLASDVPFIQTATRPINIVAAALRKGVEFGESFSQVSRKALRSADAEALFVTAETLDSDLQGAVADESIDRLVAGLTRLSEPINRFFDSTMAMADEPEVRHARLTLLNSVANQLMLAGDWSKIVVEG